MRALVCSSLDGFDGVAVGELPDPTPGPGEVRLRVHAAGVNFPDVLIIKGLYQDRPDLPFAPGAEVAGEVVEVGDGTAGVEVGDRVYASIRHGGFAEQAVVGVDRIFHIPDGMPYEQAAVLPLAYGTAYHALLDRGGLAEGETLLVLGAAGGVGLAAVQIGATVGARVLAAVSSDDKATAVRAAGADEVIRYDRTGLRDAMRSAAPDGADVVFDPVGGDATEAALRSTAWRGRLLIVGFAAGDIPTLPANLALLKGASIVGVFWGRFAQTEPERNRRMFERLGAWWTEDRIAPLVSETYDLDHATDALRRIGGRGAIGKLVVTP